MKNDEVNIIKKLLQIISSTVFVLFCAGSVYGQAIKNPYWPADPPSWKVWNTNPTTVTDAQLIAPGQVGQMAPTAVTNRLFPDDIVTPGKYMEFRTTDWAGRIYAGFWDDVYFSVDTNGCCPNTPHSWIAVGYTGDALNTKWFNSSSINSSWLNGYGYVYSVNSDVIDKFAINFTSQSTTGMGSPIANSTSTSGSYSPLVIERDWYFKNCLRAGPATTVSFTEDNSVQMTDTYQALMPCYYNSVGQSNSEIYALLKMMIVGGFLPKDLKPELKRQGIYIATLLYIWKASLPYEVPYDNELKHRVAYVSNGESLNSIANRPFHLYKDTIHMANMIAMAKTMTVAPPIAILKNISVISGTTSYTHKTTALIQQAAGQQVQLRVSTADCYDIADRPLTMRWKVLYGNQSTTIVDEGGGTYLITVPNDANLPKGRTTIMLIANNGVYDSNPACINIYRANGTTNKRPTFTGAEDSVIFPGDTVTFNLAGTDPDLTGYAVKFYKKTYDVGTITGNTYTWVSTTGTTVGAYPVSILVSDCTTGTNSKDVTITVSNTIARITPDTTIGAAPLTVNFSSAGSADLASNPLTYLWDFGDGSTSTAPNPSHIFVNPSLYRPKLTVTGPLGSHSSNITIEATKDAWSLDIDNGWSTSGLDSSVLTNINPANGSTTVLSNVLKLTITTAPYGIQSVKTYSPPFYMEVDFAPYWGGNQDGFRILGNQLGWTYTTGSVPFSYVSLNTTGTTVNIGQCQSNERVTARFYVVDDPNNAGRVRYTGYFNAALGSYFFSVDNQTFIPAPIQVIKNGYTEDIWSLKVWAPSSTPAPSLSGINPSSVVYNNACTLTITGTGFFGGTPSSNVSAVKLYTTPVTNIASYSVSSDTSIEGVVIPSGINAGTYQLKVTTSAGESTSAVFFTITPPVPVVSILTPDNGFKHLVNTISVTGNGYFGGSSSSNVTLMQLTGPATVTISNYTVINNTLIQNVIIPVLATAGSYDVRVTTGGGISATTSVKWAALADTTAPTVVSAVADTGTTMITFSEDMNPADAVVKANFSIASPSGSAAINLASAALSYLDKVTTISGLALTGTFSVTVTNARDLAGNAVGAPNTISGTVSVVDISPPVSCSVSINTGATYATSTNVTLTLNASDPGGVTNMAFSNNGSTWITSAYSTSAVWTLTGGDGTKTVSAKFKDAANNWSTAVTDTIILDQTAPGTLSMVINSGAAITRTTIVTLTYSAADTNGVTQIRYSSNGSTWLTTAYTGTTVATLSGDGIKTVSAYFKDAAGNWSGMAADTINLCSVIGLRVTGQPCVLAGSAITIVISAMLPGEIVAPQYNSTVSFSFTDTGATPISNYLFTGTATATITNVVFATLGTQKVMVTDNDISGIIGELSVEVVAGKHISAALGGVIINADGTKIEIPAGALSSDMDVAVIVTPQLLSIPASYKYKDTPRQISRDFGELDMSLPAWSLKDIVFLKPVKITIPYEKTDVGSMSEDGLKIFYYDKTTSNFSIVPGVQVVVKATLTAKGTVSAYVEHFSTYRVIGNFVGANLDSLKAYPNPYNRDTAFTGKFKITEIPVDCDLIIYNIAGEKIKTLNESKMPLFPNMGWIEWDGTNEAGEAVSPGVYVYIVKAPGGAKKIGKIGLIK